MKRALLLMSLIALVTCHPKEEKPKTPANYESEVLKWRANRLTRLTADDSWLTLVGLFWLHDGTNHFGSDATKNDVVMPAKAPAECGTITLANGKVTLEPATAMTIGGKPVSGATELLPDSDPNGPTVVQLGTMRFHIIKRGARYGIRAKDPENEARTHFKGLDYFPVDPKWRIEAKFEPYNPPKKVAIVDVLGQTNEETSPGAIVFTVDGQTVRIDPILEQGAKDFFIIIKDATSRDATYPAGRYLYASPPGPDGKVIVDFNKAYNPPCAFTPFATCPLPPPQNRMPFRIEAGEKKYAGGHH
ncbi:MAG TPA: DUF1684 domain-containing protein [Thermoanaerobaculia bacterium]|nr:DUF1684 domain-containing protein [Thermoanaerobaculia bacterium]